MVQHQSRLKIFRIILVFAFTLGACSSKVPAQTYSFFAQPVKAVLPTEASVSGNIGAQIEPTEEDNSDVEATETPEPQNTDSGDGSSSTAASPAGQGKLISDLGFRPDKNGFSFENYGDDEVTKNLTSVEMQRMFGDVVCQRIKAGQCELTPTAKQWMDETNTDMGGGHCEGMATLSLLMFTNQVKADAFGAKLAHDLTLSNEKLDHEIAYWWATQSTDPTDLKSIEGTPNDILNVLKKLKPGAETYTIGIADRNGDNGHAITPFAVEDDGGGIYSVLVYDNNIPDEIRKLKIDSNKNTWSYEASINPETDPELYEGDAESQSLDLTPTSVRLQPQQCPFCSDSSSARGKGGLADQAVKYNEIYLDGEGHLLIQDPQGNQLGYLNGKFINKIPGATYINEKIANKDASSPEPIYKVPSDMNIEAIIDGSTLKKESPTDLVLFGNGFSVGVEGISLDPQQKDTVQLNPKTQSIVYDTGSSESPNFVITDDRAGGNGYEFEIKGTGMKGGGAISVSMDSKKGELLINTQKLKEEGQFSFSMTRYTETDDETYSADDIALKAGAVVHVNYADWKGNGKGLNFGVDTNGDGTIDDTYEMDDAAQ